MGPHKKEIESMLEYALDEAKKHSIEISEVYGCRVNGSASGFESVIANYDAAICLGIMRKVKHYGSAMGNAVIKSVVDLQLTQQHRFGHNWSRG